MIKLKIEKYRDFTEEENKAREEKRRNGYYTSNFNEFKDVKCFEKALEVELTEEQWNAIRKAVIEVF